MFKHNNTNIDLILFQSKVLLLIQFILITCIILTLFFVSKEYIEIFLIFSLFIIVFGIILTVSLLTVRKRIFINQCLEKIVKSDCISLNYSKEKNKKNDVLIIRNKYLDSIIKIINLIKKNFSISDKRDRTKLESQIIQSGKLTAMGELTAGIAHELNNPLGGILGYVQFMLEKIKDGKVKSDSDVISIKKYLEFIERETIRCRRIIKNLLQFSRPSQMQISNNIDLNVILVDSISIVEYQMHAEQVEFIKNLDSSIPLIKGDPVQLQQVFINLLINAMHAIGVNKKGEIVISSKLIGNDKDGKMVEIEIKDNGCGIPSEIIDKIFDPFFTTKKHGEGTGLGLSLSYGIIKAHKGEITVSSNQNTGSTFNILMPVLAGRK